MHSSRMPTASFGGYQLKSVPTTLPRGRPPFWGTPLWSGGRRPPQKNMGPDSRWHHPPVNRQRGVKPLPSLNLAGGNERPFTVKRVRFTGVKLSNSVYMDYIVWYIDALLRLRKGDVLTRVCLFTGRVGFWICLVPSSFWGVGMSGPRFFLWVGCVQGRGWVCPARAGISKGKWVHPRRKWVYRTKVGIPEGVGGGWVCISTCRPGTWDAQSPVLTPSVGHHNTYGWQADGTHGMPSCVSLSRAFDEIDL